MGKFQGVIMPQTPMAGGRHGEFVGEFGRHGRAEEAAAFAGVVVGGVDGFLHVAAVSLMTLPISRSCRGVVFFALDEDFGGAEDHFGATRSGNEAPLGIGALAASTRHPHRLCSSVGRCDDFAVSADCDLRKFVRCESTHSPSMKFLQILVLVVLVVP